MAEGVQNAACVLCFIGTQYQNSANCQLELKFARQSGVPIVAVRVQDGFIASKWLGIILAGVLWIPLPSDLSQDEFSTIIEKVTEQIKLVVATSSSIYSAEASENGSTYDEWDEELFSHDDVRGELSRLKDGILGGNNQYHRLTELENGALCPLPPSMPPAPVGFRVSKF